MKPAPITPVGSLAAASRPVPARAESVRAEPVPVQVPASRGLGRRFAQYVLHRSFAEIITVAVFIVGVIGLGDFVSTWELSLFVFYAVPIFLVAWHSSQRAGIIIAVLCSVVWFGANFPTHPYLTLEGYIWATVNRAVYFIIVAYGGSSMRTQREESAARIAALDHARQLEGELLRAGEREQMRIGQDLHDGVCQSLAAISCATECLRADLESGRPSAPAQVALIQKMLRDTMMEARSLARGIFPVQMDAEGLTAAIQELVANNNQLRQAAIGFESSGEIHLADPQVSMHLYRIVQESLSNALRHSGASRILISLSQKRRRLVLEVDDDGRGLPASSSTSSGMGLRTMRYRAQLIGAEFAVTNKSAGGVLVRCALTLPQ